ncbi:MAG TPA: phosphoribosyl-ATP diphosphatase [Alphaproteobacteria bacterium]|nr:phosphoribosyl-ATP diphosphatase [Alphaproteobacteria bacterium]USO05235.1 MAG: phosphoribosyl-ATP diphosphatase [Rhodospirillales bacterium]HOO80996.1 phosphoribosyl-ATP diphosphatase [Alphaproteobacteria bacterium]
MSAHILEKLYAVLQERKKADPESSYVASLYDKGSVKISEKIREEAEETIVEGLRLEKSSGDEAIRQALTNESADLVFHLLVLLSYHNIAPEDVFAVLERRFGISGHEEKASRGH